MHDIQIGLNILVSWWVNLLVPWENHDNLLQKHSNAGGEMECRTKKNALSWFPKSLECLPTQLMNTASGFIRHYEGLFCSFML